MAVRGEEVASSIDAQVRDAIEKMVAEIRSSVEDVQVAVDQQLKAALQSVQADVNAISFLPQIRKSIGELEETFATAAPPPPAGADSARIKAAVQAIERGRSQVDVLNTLLEQCREFGSRAALLILRGETFSGWKGAGFSAHGGSDDNVKRFNAAPGQVPELDGILRDEQVIIWDGGNLAARLGGVPCDRALLVPMVIKDKVAAAVYVDAIGDDVAKLDQNAIELLVFTTGLLVDTLAIRKKIPSPSLSTGTTEALSTPVQATPAAAPAAPAYAAEPEVEPTVPKQTDAGTVAIPEQVRKVIESERPSFNMPSAEEFSGTPEATPPVAPPPPPPAAAAPAPEPPRTETVPHAEDRPSTQYIPPPGLRGGARIATEDTKKHDEARRFARLLVSEIKLYNESKVEQGRKNNDLYERLKEDIDRSRQMYDERVSDEVRKESNYFYDELVRVLADGRADALGL